MTEKHLTRRALLLGMAAVPFLESTSEAQAAASPVCFMSAVEMARLIRAKKAVGARSAGRAPEADRARQPEGQCHRDPGAGNGRRSRREGR